MGGVWNSPEECRKGLSSLIYLVLADLVLVLHFTFILFVMSGAVLVLRWRRIAWIHVPCALWGAWIAFQGWICPLTPVENRFRRLGGEAGYSGGFIEHYLLPLIYPSGLTRSTQIQLGVIVVVINVAVYGLICWRRWRAHKDRPTLKA